jgi:hypothetical protein
MHPPKHQWLVTAPKRKEKSVKEKKEKRTTSTYRFRQIVINVIILDDER